VRDPLNDDLIAALHTGEVDIALGTELDLPAGIEAIPVATDELVAVLPRKHRLAQGAPGSALRWRDLQGERLALFARGSTYAWPWPPCAKKAWRWWTPTDCSTANRCSAWCAAAWRWA
jgi:DNA-binding transcriptional LysR family regulator